MALTRTCLQLETEARQRADEVGSSFRDSATYKRYLSASCRRLVGKFHHLSDHWTQLTVLITTAGAMTTQVPTQAWKLLAMRTTINGERMRLGQASVDMIDMEVTPSGWADGVLPRYILRGSSIFWVPTPTAAHVITVDFLPTMLFTSGSKDEFTADGDTFDGIFGWEQWVVLDTAMKVLRDKGKADAAAALAVEQSEVASEIALQAMHRGSEDAPKSRDVWPGEGYE